MKKIMLAGCCIALCLYTHAQPGEDDKKKKKVDLQFSVIGGIDFSGLGGDGENKSMLTGGQFGFQANIIDLSDRMSLRAGAEYSMQGGKSKTEGEGEPGMSYSYESQLRLNYLNFPVVTKYSSPGGFFAEGGLQPGVLLSAKSKSGGYTSNSKDYLNKFDLGLVAGAGFRFKNNFGVGARVVPGLLNINKKQNGYDPPKNRNLVLGLRASYTF